jgi:hypothetical protein
VANGGTARLFEYPFMPREDMMARLDYAASLAEEQVTAIEVANLLGMTVDPFRLLVHDLKDHGHSYPRLLQPNSVRHG